MGATFTYAARYQIAAVCRTPLRTGGADGDAETVLRDGQGRAFLQGTSVAGALRAWLEAKPAPELAERLLGRRQVSGRLIVSDALFDPDAEQYVRPRLHIDPAAGVLAPGGKFDMAHIGARATLRFTLTWLGSREYEDELETVERMLAALDSGEIRLGAQKANGFGRVELTVTKRLFDMTDPRDRRAWLFDAADFQDRRDRPDDVDDGDILELPRAADSRRVTFTVAGRVDSILIRAASAEQAARGSYTPNLSEGGRSILPGSSVKGAVRARAEAIAAAAGLGDETVQKLFGRKAGGGGSGIPGQAWFEDALLSGGKRKTARIRINKFTGGVIRGGLFQEEPVSSEVTLRISVPAGDRVACALILFALRDLGMGLYNLGGGGAVGRGYVTVQTIEAAAPDGRATLSFDGPLECSLHDPNGLIEEWLDAWGGAMREN